MPGDQLGRSRAFRILNRRPPLAVGEGWDRSRRPVKSTPALDVLLVFALLLALIPIE